MTFEPTPTPEIVTPQPVEPDRKGLAIASLVIGIINLLAWCLPICGGPLAIAGIILGIFGLKSSSRGMAIAGLVLSGIGLLLSIINAVAGIALFNSGALNNFYNYFNF